MARFLPLTVREVRRETRDAVALTLEPRPEDAGAFAFRHGQYLTFRRDFDGQEVRRSYSICAGAGERLRVGVKRVDGGAFSTWANEALKPGDVLEAMPPMGGFTAALDPAQARHYLLFAAGSGITPVLGILRTVLAQEPKATATLVYGNRSAASIMFREELEDLKNLHLGRLSVLHVLSGEGQDAELFSGRIDAAKCAQLFDRWIDVPSADLAFVCGPEAMMLAVQGALREHGMAPEKIRVELFAAGQQGRAPRKAAAATAAGGACVQASVTLDGATRAIEIARDGQSILDAALAANIDAPYACKAGVCSTCRALVLEGETEMAANYALEDYEVRRGYVLTCQARPLSDRVVVSYDQ